MIKTTILFFIPFFLHTDFFILIFSQKGLISHAFFLSLIKTKVRKKTVVSLSCRAQ
jgi:hypothetical protein